MELTAQIVDARLELPRSRASVGRSVRAVPGFDEDVVTLAAEAALELASEYKPKALVIATTSAPLAEGGAAPILTEIPI